MKPIFNLDEAVDFDDVEDNGRYCSKRALFSESIGARQLGYNLTVLPPGKVQCPFHSHRGEEEMFLILEGEGELRFGEKRYPIRKHDVIACPTGGAEVAHQIINTGKTDMRYLAVSTLAAVEVCEYPDSGKVSLWTEGGSSPGLRKIFRAEQTVDYYDREKE
ncbi:MAG: cupin domain-containing protein [Parvibaculaceae bacterium]|nr:cupin domain-containing protein [Parvibaculaceae bacterium]